jgi:osmoprotectant transport system substrate-binding protein
MRTVRARRSARVAVALVLVLLAGCSAEATLPAEPSLPAGTIRIAAYDFLENQTLAAVYAEAVRRAGLPVIVQSGSGTREIVEPALEQAKADVVIEYLGTAEAFVRRGEPSRAATIDVRAALARALAPRGVTVLEPAQAEDQNGFAVSSSFAAEHHVGKLSELAPLAGELVFGGPPECPDRPLCLPGLEQVYGLHFGQVVSVSSRSATVEALVSGQIQVGLLETTDARLQTAPVLLLLDDRSLQPHENVVPLIRTAVLDRWGERLQTALDGVSARLNTQELVALNRAVEVGGLAPEVAAHEWWDRQSR